MLDNLYNVVSIGMWVPFNEGWGQFDSAWFSERTKEFDAHQVDWDLMSKRMAAFKPEEAKAKEHVCFS